MECTDGYKPAMKEIRMVLAIILNYKIQNNCREAVEIQYSC